MPDSIIVVEAKFSEMEAHEKEVDQLKKLKDILDTELKKIPEEHALKESYKKSLEILDKHIKQYDVMKNNLRTNRDFVKTNHQTMSEIKPGKVIKKMFTSPMRTTAALQVAIKQRLRLDNDFKKCYQECKQFMNSTTHLIEKIKTYPGVGEAFLKSDKPADLEEKSTSGIHSLPRLRR